MALNSAFLTLLVSVLAFASAALAVYAFAPALITRSATQRRLTAGTVVTNASGGSLRQESVRSFWTKLVATLEARGLALADSDPDGLRGRMVSAGYTHPDAARFYVLARVALTIGLPLAYLVCAPFFQRDVSVLGLYQVSALLALAGFYIPKIYVSIRGSRRQRELTNAFPDGLDLMLVCIEAGLGLDAAFNRVGQEMVRSAPLLSEQLAIVTLELRAGRSREDALRRLAERSGVEEIRAFTTLLIQSEKLGASIGQTLRIYASEMRERRRMRAEEKAHRIPVLISIPLVGFMLPTMIGVLMLPAVITFIRDVAPHMGAR
jgi:tight adherence protein C